MRVIKNSSVVNAVAELCKKAAYTLPQDIIKSLTAAKRTEKGLAKEIIKLTLENLSLKNLFLKGKTQKPIHRQLFITR